MINPEVFREYDIRGVAERDLTDPVVETLGTAFGEYLQPKSATRVTLGYDMRLSSLRIRDAFIRGITKSGIQVMDIGLCPTPALYFSLFQLKPDAGVMITASHNPPEFNGFKLCVGTDTIYGDEIQKIRRISEKIAAAKRSSSKTSPGAILHKSIMPDYISYLQKAFPVCQEIPLTVVLDAGNATAGLAAPEVIRAMGCKVIELYSEPDGTFPNHHPDPTVPQNLTALIKTVIENRADMGIAFDGDSDRIGIVDDKGQMIWGDQLMILFSRDILLERPGATFISEVKCSQTMYDDIRAHGGNAVMWKTGHSLIKAKMKETGAVMAAEMSGHLFFADRYFGYDDAIYAACRLVELLKKFKANFSFQTSRVATLSTLLTDIPTTYNTPEIRVDCPDAIKFKIVDRIREIVKNGHGLPLKPREVITIDGLRVVFDHGWGLIRASNTQPVLVMRFEANDQCSLETIRVMIEAKVHDIIQELTKTN